MTRLVSASGLGLALAFVGCGGTSIPTAPGSTGGAGATGGLAGQASGAPGMTGGTGSGAGSTSGGGTAGAGSRTDGGSSGSGATGAGRGGTAQTGGGAGVGAGVGVSAAGSGAAGAAGSGAAGTGAAGMAGTGTPVVLPPLVTSADGAYWKTSDTLAPSTADADVTVNDAAVAQTWDGFGGAFNELGWSYLVTPEMQDQAMTLLFSASEGAAFAWGRIPIGASDYAVSRYTDDDTGTDVTPSGDESNRPPADATLAQFTLDRDAQRLIPYIKAAQAKNPHLRFWASPWTPPVWMKSGYKTDSGADGTSAKKPSYFDGGTMKSDASDLAAYAQYYTRFVTGYQTQGIDIEVVSPQNEPGFDQNYPSCLWDEATYVSWVGEYLGPAMKAIGVNVMLGTLSNAGDSGRSDVYIANAVLADPAAKNFVSVVGAQWDVLDWIDNGTTTFGALPVWATEHKCGNYPWCVSTGNGCPSAYDTNEAPNDQAYAEESWYYLRDAINKGKVTAYNAWNMVLDKLGLGIDTSRDWKQNASLVADSGKVNPTPAYYVFRHFSQYVAPGALVVGTSGGDAVAFKNPDGSLVAVLFNGGAANGSYVVALGGKKFEFAMPSHGWATVKYKP